MRSREKEENAARRRRSVSVSASERRGRWQRDIEQTLTANRWFFAQRMRRAVRGNAGSGDAAGGSCWHRQSVLAQRYGACDTVGVTDLAERSAGKKDHFSMRTSEKDIKHLRRAVYSMGRTNNVLHEQTGDKTQSGATVAPRR